MTTISGIPDPES